jgi:hypothetical protein
MKNEVRSVWIYSRLCFKYNTRIMAKELPYFKFEPNQWENGNIQICSRENKGLFIDLCSMYWSRLGDLPVKLAIQKLCAGNANALNSLFDENIIEQKDGYICIDFLNEQLSEFKNTSSQNSKNAKERWEKHRKQKEESERNATASIPQSESDTIKENNIIENKIKENNIEERKLKFATSLSIFNSIYERKMIKDFYEYWTEPNKSNSKFRMEMEKTWDLERRLKTWASRDKGFQSNKKESEPIVAGRQTASTIQQNLDATGLYVPSQQNNL